MKLLCRNNSSLLPFARNCLYLPSVSVQKKWESCGREISTDEVHVFPRSLPSASSSRGKFNLVGPRHHGSNIRKIIFAKLKNESTKERYFREQQQELNTWNQNFWGKQNEKFNKSKKAFLQLRPRNLETDTNKELADELSKFYRDFLDGNYNVHSQYLRNYVLPFVLNRDWYRRNFHLLWTGIQVSVFRILSKIMPKRSR
ncbi:unnamed protein product [Pocillopora meandrina]|uniref:Apoptogenic protein 1, mitochondrial n=1 Tax=Pocillopora meandrina TaxID=46732 RepID=A0AAU9WWB6_9CNID|nr:unnamed protein product [Pocillopora meandrina]